MVNHDPWSTCHRPTKDHWTKIRQKTSDNIRPSQYHHVSSCIINIDHNIHSPLKNTIDCWQSTYPSVIPWKNHQHHQHHWGGEFTFKKRTGPGPPRHVTSRHVAPQRDAGLCRRLPAAQRFVLVRRAGHGQGPGQEGNRDVAGGGEEAFQAETRNHGFFSW